MLDERVLSTEIAATCEMATTEGYSEAWAMMDVPLPINALEFEIFLFLHVFSCLARSYTGKFLEMLSF